MKHFKHDRCAFVLGLGLIALVASARAQAWREVLSPTTVTTLYLTMDETDWNTIRNETPVEGDTAALTRAPAWMHATNETPIQVTIRRKGPTDPTLGGNQKVSLKIDIAELVPGQSWRGLKKLSLEIGGTSPLHEGFAWVVHNLADEAGFYPYDAANVGWVQLYINGDLKGFYTCAEQRDKQFMKNHDIYSPDSTWLYKVDGGIALQTGPPTPSPAFTHLDYAPFGGQAALSELGLETDMPQWVDVQGLLTYAACMTFVQNKDMLFKKPAKNSFAVDFDPPQLRKRQYYPWDMDAAFGGSFDLDIMLGGGPANPYRDEILEHPWFKQMYQAIYRKLLQGPLSISSLTNILYQIEPVVTPYMEADPYISAGGFDSLSNWMSNRVDDVWSQLTEPDLPPPSFNQHGGEVVSGFLLTMAAPTGAVYYTTDGSDPRAPGGTVAPSATLYAGPLSIDKTTYVIARAFDGSLWSACTTEAVFNLANYASPLRITEIMYHPADETVPGDGDDYEFIELANTGATELDLSGFYFEGIDYVFPASTTIAAGGCFLLVRNAAAFSNRYGFAADGVYLGKLSNQGEKIRLRNSDGNTQISVDYDDDPPWPLSPDGFGYSLVNINLNGDPDNPENWRASAAIHGSPCGVEPDPPYGVGVVINEVLSHTDPPYEDAIELHNPTTNMIDVSGWFLSDDLTSTNPATSYDLKKYKIPPGTQIPPGGFAVFYQRDFDLTNPRIPFALSEFGEEVFLASADGAETLNGYLVGASFGAADNGCAIGRYRTSIGVDFTALQYPTFGTGTPANLAEFRTGTGATNAPPKVGPIVINEIMYNPASGGAEFIELYNLSTAAIDITNWDIQGAGFVFPTGTVIEAGGFLLLIDTNSQSTEQFRSNYMVSASVPILGHDLILENEGETLRLEKPNDNFGEPDILVDRVEYNDKSPWPTEADGEGPSLELISPELYGNDPINWRTVEHDGSPGRTNLFPVGVAIVRGSSWNYHAAGANLGTLWRQRDYSDSGWPRGDGLLGYGDPQINTVVPSGPSPTNRYVTTYFRKDFVINDDPAAITNLQLEAWFDDGFVAYLNGVEVLRSDSMPAGTVTYFTAAVSNYNSFGYRTFDLTAATAQLTPGHNMLAVEVHQVSASSPDLVWDAALTYDVSTAPTLAPPQAIPSGGVFTNFVLVTLTNALPTADIHYTLDGSDPSMASLLYTSPVPIFVSTVLRARAFEIGYNESPVSAFIFTRVDPDTDGDGLADSVDPDDDNDGVDDLSEGIAGTDPLDSTSFLRVNLLNISTNNQINLGWPSVSNRVYSIFFSSNLYSASWWNLRNGITGMPPVNLESVPLPASERGYYRVGVEGP